MSEKNGNGGAEAAAGKGDGASAQPPLIVNAQYIKDFSFEAPGTPQIFSQMQQTQPDISVNVDVQARALEAPVYEVVLNVRADCKVGETQAFLVELSYGGVFTLNVPPADVHPVLLIECPRLLFPFARQILATTTVNGGFLPLMLGPIDFASLYQRQAREAEAVHAGAPVPPTPQA
ncbi:MAG TPA: protein-export chaperone SecB [Rhodospirillales bacterium]|nr:protein-export chaperone SecB [Rhodospirillales bacterium]